MSDQAALNVPARTIPTPSSVSAEAQRTLARWAAIPTFGAPEPDDLDAWRTRIAASNAALEGMLKPSIDGLDLKSETLSVDGVDGFVLEPREADDDGVIFDIHGGGFTSGAGELSRIFGLLTAAQFGRRVYSIDYRMPPEHPYPAALDDCMAWYRHLLKKYPASRILIRGSSAGGNLAAALALRARDEGLALPAGLILLTPEIDLTESGDTIQTNAFVDVVLKGSLMNANLLYAGGHDLADPYLSPLFGDFTQAFPPTIITAGTRDLFLSNAVRFHNKLRRAGRQSELLIEEAMPHGGFFGAPEDQLLLADLREFASRMLQSGP